MKIKNLVFNLMIAGVACNLFSCQKQDHAYAEFIKDGERVYIGKVADLKAHSGIGKVKLNFGVYDSRVSKVKIKYNDDLDSIVMDINKTEAVDYIETIIDNLDERTYTFKVYALDKSGNSSISQNVDGQSFGNNHLLTLTNRYISSKTVSGTTVTLNWVAINSSSRRGAVETEVEYTDNATGSLKTSILPIDTDRIVLTGVNTSKGLRYRTKYLPATDAFEFMYTNYATYSF